MNSRLENRQTENSRVEQYVSELSKGLEDLSETRKAEELAEIRQHLEARVKACEELGLDETEAQEEAVRQFGSARVVSGGLRKAYWREKFFVTDSLWGTALLAVCLQFVVVGILSPLNQILSLAGSAAFGIQGDMRQIAASFAAMLLPTLLSGYLVGRWNPRYAVRGVLFGKSAFTIYSLLGMYAFFLVNNATHETVVLWPALTLWGLLANAVMGIALSTFAAYIGSRHASRGGVKA